jgi:hypothetical protein
MPAALRCGWHDEIEHASAVLTLQPSRWQRGVTCGSELHPERAAKYDYCTRRECRIHHARGMRPDEIARERGLPTGTVIQMLLAARDDR